MSAALLAKTKWSRLRDPDRKVSVDYRERVCPEEELGIGAWVLIAADAESERSQ